MKNISEPFLYGTQATLRNFLLMAGIVAFNEVDTEDIRYLDVHKFPFVGAIDSQRNNIYKMARD